MNSVYIAAPIEKRDYALRIMRILQIRNITVTSSWINHPQQLSHEGAMTDLQDLRNADLLVALNPEGWEKHGTGGRHVELGYALALGKPVLLVGERSNMFHRLHHIKVVDEGEDISKHVQKLLAAPRTV